VWLSFLIYPCEEGKRYVAHCLETDTVAVGDTKAGAVRLLKDLLADLFETLAAEGEFGKAFRPAPQQYWQAYADAKQYCPPERIRKKRICRRIRRVLYRQVGANLNVDDG